MWNTKNHGVLQGRYSNDSMQNMKIDSFIDAVSENKDQRPDLGGYDVVTRGEHAGLAPFSCTGRKTFLQIFQLERGRIQV